MIISQGIFASILLLVNRTNKRANIFLGLLVLAFSLWLCDSFFSLAGIYGQNPNYYFLPIYFSLAFGPLVYFYTQTLVIKEFVFSKKDWLHFIPVLFQAVLYFVLRMGSYQDRRWFWMEVHEPITYNLEFNLSFISLVIYLFLSIKLVVKYQDWIKNEYSEISKINLKWLRQLLTGMIVLSVLWLIEAFLRTFFNYFPDTLIMALPMGLFILFMATGGLLQKAISGISIQEDKKSIKTEQILDKVLLRKVTEQMLQKEYYLNPELTLEFFAHEIGEKKRAVSNCINQGLKIPFIDFVNMHRVEAFKKMILKKDSEKFSLLGLAFESGFNSKSTFNRVFKYIEGVSPSEYKQVNKNDYLAKS